MARPLSYLDWRDVFWQYFMTVVSSYPATPSQLLKKKVYRFVSDAPSMIPDPQFRTRFVALLSDYPVSPYLDSQQDLSRWLNFFRNRVAEMYNEPIRTEAERWTEYADALGPKPPPKKHHPKWYAMVAMCAAACIVVLVAQSDGSKPLTR